MQFKCCSEIKMVLTFCKISAKTCADYLAMTVPGWWMLSISENTLYAGSEVFRAATTHMKKKLAVLPVSVFCRV